MSISWPREQDYWTTHSGKLLGTGGYSRVYLVHDAEGNEMVLKQLKRLDSASRHEVEALLALQQSGAADRCGLAQIKRVLWAPRWEDRGKPRRWSLVPSVELEYVRGQDLYSVLSRHELDTAQVLAIARDLLQTLNCLHKRGLIHRDIKLENVIWDGERQRARLIDYGFLCAQDRRRGIELCSEAAPAGTRDYLAPEIYNSLMQPTFDQFAQRSRQNASSDLWALGVLLWELLSGSAVGPLQSKQAAERLAREIQKPKESTPKLLSLIRQMLAIDPKKRPSAKTLLAQLD